jgi:hypothetical protein
MSAPTPLQARLLPDGHVVVQGAAPDPGATWEVLGYTREEATTMGFVRVEMRGASWTTRVERAHLEHPHSEVMVTLAQQSGPDSEPLLGWILFC